MCVSYSSISLEHMSDLTHFHTHTWADTQLQTTIHSPYTNPYTGAYCAESRNERNWCGMSEFFRGVDALQCLLLVRPTEACLLSAAGPLSETSICCRESWESQQRSASCCRSSLSHTACTLFIQKDMGAGHPSLTEKKENKDEIQVRSHPETCRQGLACERRPAAQRWGYFWSREGFTQWIYITGIPFMSALKRDFSCCSEETLEIWKGALKQQCAIFRHVCRLYKPQCDS